jgi:hypothetical protein
VAGFGRQLRWSDNTRKLSKQRNRKREFPARVRPIELADDIGANAPERGNDKGKKAKTNRRGRISTFRRTRRE